MTLADTAGIALGLTAVLAVAARLAGALTTGGAIAGALVGTCVGLGFGLPGLAVLAIFFVAGSLATRAGWETKTASGVAEAGGGRRDARRVLGKGGVAALVAVLQLFDGAGLLAAPAAAFTGAVAAALADTFATEFGVLWSSAPRRLPTFRRVPVGTPGAVSLAGTLAAFLGSFVVADVAVDLASLVKSEGATVRWLTVAGLAAALLESLAVGLGLRAPGFVRNVLTTATGAVLAELLLGRLG
jgi:uncharacterized protein (TIGR00297 family)